MMTVREMKKRKKELGYTNRMVAERSGVPLGTVQKIFSGATKNPRIDTLEAMDLALKEPLPYEYSFDAPDDSCHVAQDTAEYSPVSGGPDDSRTKAAAARVDRWMAHAPAKRWPRQGSYTTEDFFSVPDDSRVELIDGVMYDLMAPGRRHQKIVGEMYYAFYRCIEEHDKDCEVLFAPYAVRLDKDSRTMVLPDLLILCGRDEKETEKYYDGAPDLVAEVLSPSTRAVDCTVKLRKYMNAGVREYWIVDPENEKVTVYVFEKDVLPTQYSFDDSIPVGISGGECSIDLSRIKLRLR